MNAPWFALFLVTFSECLSAEFAPLAEIPRIQSPAITEASGLAISPTDPDFMWVLNDSGGTPDIHLLGADGTERGKLTVKGVKNIDWEDLASFTLDGKSYLLIADTGDNDAKRESPIFYILQEPTLPAAGKNLAITAVPAWKVPFRYEGGPRDCESVAVDAKAEKIFFISKRTLPPELYELPLRAPVKSTIQVAQPLTPVTVKSPAGELFPIANQPTSLAIAADGSLAAVITYYSIFLFPKSSGQTWKEAFSQKPKILPPHGLAQAESVAFSMDGKTLFAISEGQSSPIVRYREKESDPSSP